VAPVNPIPVTAGHTIENSFFVVAPPDAFVAGSREVTIRITDGAGFTTELPYRLQGPGAGAGP
jgi:hypothetical protein